jgi:hypothetical protein
MLYRSWILAALLLLTLAGCASTGGTTDNGGGDEPVDPTSDTETEAWATKMYGDARVYYYVKQGAQGVAGAAQKEVRYTLINKTHSLYRGLPDNQLRADEYYISNADMMDMLNGLRKKCSFFEISREIGSRDPLQAGPVPALQPDGALSRRRNHQGRRGELRLFPAPADQ